MEIKDASTGEVKVGRTGVESRTRSRPQHVMSLNSMYVGQRKHLSKPGTHHQTTTRAHFLDSDISGNILSFHEISFSLQSNKEADPTTATIAAQIKRVRLQLIIALAVVAFKVWKTT